MGVTKYNKKTGRRIRNKSTGRDYKKEYANYQGKPDQIKRRSSRNSARSAAVKAGKAKKGDGKDIHHKGKKIKIEPKSKNRGRKEKSRLKGSKRR